MIHLRGSEVAPPGLVPNIGSLCLWTTLKSERERDEDEEDDCRGWGWDSLSILLGSRLGESQFKNTEPDRQTLISSLLTFSTAPHWPSCRWGLAGLPGSLPPI